MKDRIRFRREAFSCWKVLVKLSFVSISHQNKTPRFSVTLDHNDNGNAVPKTTNMTPRLLNEVEEQRKRREQRKQERQRAMSSTPIPMFSIEQDKMINTSSNSNNSTSSGSSSSADTSNKMHNSITTSPSQACSQHWPSPRSGTCRNDLTKC